MGMLRFQAAIALVLSSMSATSLAQVSVVVRDQSGSPIAGSKVDITGVGLVSSGDSVNLPPATYSARVIPAVLGFASASRLSRSESFTVSTGQTVVEFEWITATVTIDVVDQGSSSIA